MQIMIWGYYYSQLLFVNKVDSSTTAFTGVKIIHLLAEVSDLAIAEIKLVHQGLAIEEMVEGLSSHLEEAGAQPKKTSSDKGRDATWRQHYRGDTTAQHDLKIIDKSWSIWDR